MEEVVVLVVVLAAAVEVVHTLYINSSYTYTCTSTFIDLLYAWKRNPLNIDEHSMFSAYIWPKK